MKYDLLLKSSIFLFFTKDFQWLSINVLGAYLHYSDIAIILLIIIKLGSLNFRSHLTLALALILVSTLIKYLYIPINIIDLKVQLNTIIFFLYGIYITSSCSISDVEKLLGIIFYSACFVALATIIRSIGVDWIPGYDRQVTQYFVGLKFGNVALMVAGLNFSLLMIIGLAVAISQKRNIFYFSVIVLACILSFKRALWISIFIEVIIYYFMFNVRFSNTRTKYVLILSVALIFSTAGILFLNELLEMRGGTVDQRMDSYFATLDLIKNYPFMSFFGFGKHFYLEESGINVLPHNVVLELFIIGGIFIFVPFCYLFYFALRNLKKMKCIRLKESLLISFFGMVALAMTAPVYNSLLFWLLLIFMFARNQKLYLNEGDL